MVINQLIILLFTVYVILNDNQVNQMWCTHVKVAFALQGFLEKYLGENNIMYLLFSAVSNL